MRGVFKFSAVFLEKDGKIKHQTFPTLAMLKPCKSCKDSPVLTSILSTRTKRLEPSL
jgi:hypothetical protein